MSLLTPLIEFAAERGILIGSKRIEANDDLLLFPEEVGPMRNAVRSARQQSGAARAIARSLLQQLGLPVCAIPKAASGVAVWPHGIAGSLAHDGIFAAAAVTRKSNSVSIGIDIEADSPMPRAMAELVATPEEQRRYPRDILNSRQLFVAKEAVFKAAFPIDGALLDFQDVDVDIARGIALTAKGLRVDFRLSRGARLAALAVVESEFRGRR